MRSLKAMRLAVGGLAFYLLFQIGVTKAETVAPATETPSILVKSFKPEGHTLISTKALHALFERYLEVWPIPPEGLQISPAKLRLFLEAVLNFYLRLGHSGIYVYIPQDSIVSHAPLTFKNNQLLLRIVEGRVQEVTTSYNVQRRWRPWQGLEKLGRPESVSAAESGMEKQADWIRRWNRIQSNEVVQRKELEDFVDFLERHPGRSAAALVKKTEAPVTPQAIGRDVAIDMRVLDAAPMTFYAQFSNTGSESTEEYRLGFGFIHNSLFGRDDIFNLNLQAAASDEMTNNFGAFVSYDAPLWNPWWRGQLHATYSEFQSTDILGPGTPFIGEGYGAGGQISYNLWQDGGWFFDVFQGLDYQNSKVETPFGFDSDVNLLDISVGTRLEHNRGDYRASYEAEIAYNLTDVLGLSSADDFNNSRIGTEPGFFLFSLRGHHQKEVLKGISIFQGFGALYSPDRLVTARELSIGGLNTVRGYEEFEVLGDYGVYLSTEPRINLNTFLSGARIPFQADLIPLFFDIGSVWVNDGLPGEDAHTTIYSVGSGFRFYLDDAFFARFYWGYALQDAKENDPDATESGESRFHLDVSLRF